MQMAVNPVNLWVFPVPFVNDPLSIAYQYSVTPTLSLAVTVTFISVWRWEKGAYFFSWGRMDIKWDRYL